MRRVLIISLAFLTLAACKEEEVPTFPPEIPSASVSCGDATGDNYPTVAEVGVEITDADRDLVTDSIAITVNGIRLEEVADDDADDIYTWTPPSSWDPPMVCAGGTFRIIVEARDLEGHEVKQTFEVEGDA